MYYIDHVLGKNKNTSANILMNEIYGDDRFSFYATLLEASHIHYSIGAVYEAA